MTTDSGTIDPAPEDLDARKPGVRMISIQLGQRVSRSPDERAARGRAERAAHPRSAHARWEPSPGRRSPVELLEQQARSRVPELVPIRYGRMLVSPLTFFRGAAYLMAADLATTPRTGLHAQLCGDAHLSNFGVFAAPDRRLVFSINDFDETLPGPFEWDLKRLAAATSMPQSIEQSTQPTEPTRQSPRRRPPRETDRPAPATPFPARAASAHPRCPRPD